MKADNADGQSMEKDHYLVLGSLGTAVHQFGCYKKYRKLVRRRTVIIMEHLPRLNHEHGLEMNDFLRQSISSVHNYSLQQSRWTATVQVKVHSLASNAT